MYSLIKYYFYSGGFLYDAETNVMALPSELIIDGMTRAKAEEELSKAITAVTLPIPGDSPLVPILSYPSTVLSRMKEIVT